MKKTLIKIAGICLISTIVFGSCKKSDSEDSPAPSGGSSTPKTTYTDPIGTSPGTFKVDSIATLPFAIMPKLFPSGIFETSDKNAMVFKTDSTYEQLSYKGESIRFVYTPTSGYWGTSWLRNGSWTASMLITSKVKKMTMKVRSPYNCNVTFLPFGTDKYGKKELYQKSNTAAATPVWETIEIPLSGYPSGVFAAALTMGIDFGAGSGSPLGKPAAGTQVVIDVKDIQFE